MDRPPLSRYTGRDVVVAGEVAARRRAAASVVAVLLGAVVWGGWLGWDGGFTPYAGDGVSVGGYSELQGAGCVASLVVAVVVLTCLGRPFEGVTGVGLGFWLPWTVDALLAYRSAFVGVGALLLALGLLGGGALVAWATSAVVAVVRRA